ncbi:hypothetical protein ACFWY9_20885 [Amycolatopsis sp. NPDC059027]|uniref:hypothetical protein n=1 Tax=Amycolatopsis sp. NPDC059027 TaxID=3346709 RepID=UPI00366CC72E
MSGEGVTGLAVLGLPQDRLSASFDVGCPMVVSFVRLADPEPLEAVAGLSRGGSASSTRRNPLVCKATTATALADRVDSFSERGH